MRRFEIAGCVAAIGDAAMGQPDVHSIVSALLAMDLGTAAGLDGETVRASAYIALLRWSGCTANAAEFGLLLGDDVRGRADLIERGPTAIDASRAVAFSQGRVELTTAHCEVAAETALRIGLPAVAASGLATVFERWDGGGAPVGLAGDAIPIATRIAAIAGDLALLIRRQPGTAASEALAAQAGSDHDPDLVAIAITGAPAWLAGLDLVAPWAQLDRRLRDDLDLGDDLDLDLGGTSVLADLADLKTPWALGMGRRVAELAAAAASARGEDARLATNAGLLHRIGRAGVANPVWESRGPLSEAGWEQARLVPYRTLRMARRCPALGGAAELASLVHERLDGSGYFRGARASSIPPLARVLQAAVTWVGLTSDRPDRPSRGSSQASSQLRAEARAGRLDDESVAAVLEAVGASEGRRARPTGLTAREREVLARLATGSSTSEVAAELHLSVKTVGAHAEHIYRKLGVRSRAAASLHAVRLGLLAGDPL